MKPVQKKGILEEPSGHGGPYSKIERIWQSLPSGYSIDVRRSERFDNISNLLYSPVEYIVEDMTNEVPDGLPDEQWVSENFSSFVLGEFGNDHMRTPPFSFEPIERIADVVTNAPQIYLEKCEAELVYGGILRGLNTRNAITIEDAIINVLSSPLLGNPMNQKYINKEAFSISITPSIKEHKRLQFIVPGFPFKDQNIFRTESEPDHLDMGEISLLIRLHALALAFFQIHPFGADWIILSDGLAYSKIFGVDTKSAEAYRENLRDVRNKLNLQGTVSILDLNQIAHHADGENNIGRFDYLVNEVIKILHKLTDSNDKVNKSFSVLTRGMMWNLSTREYETQYSREEIWHAVTDTSLRRSGAFEEEILDRSRIAAFYYGAYNLALRWYNIPKRIFPNAIRATVHPKPGQIAIPSIGNVYPWNGVPIVHKGTFRANDITVSPWYELRKQGKNLLGHVERNSKAPLYYTVI